MDIIWYFSFGIFGFLAGQFLPTYFKKKGENLATKEDIAEITHRIESVKLTYQQAAEATKTSFSNSLAVIARKREVYANLASSLNVFVSSPDQEHLDTLKKQFLEGYPLIWLWAADAVVEALNEIVGTNEEQTRTGQFNQDEMKRLHAKCILEMRRDAGFAETTLDGSSYRFFEFGADRRNPPNSG